MKAFILLSALAVAFATECGENEHFVNCGTAYPLTCENYQDPPKSYVVKGGIGCRCHKGYVRSGDGRCVRPEQCPGSAPKPVCGKNQRYLECGTACPLTCDNYDNPPRICIDMCVAGCHCEPGYVKTRDGRCVTVEDCLNKASATPEFCNLPAERGMCHAYFPRYFYNQETGKCEKFYYGGCDGNENNFSTEEECQSICGSS